MAVADRTPLLTVAPANAVLPVEARWHGARTQWDIGRDGPLRDFVARSLRNWFVAVGAPTQA